MACTNWFKGITTLEELKSLYKKLAKKWHPDMSKSVDTTKIFVEIVAQYDILYKILSQKAKNSQDSTDFKQKHSADSTLFRNIIDKLLKFDFINVEVCGSWVWVSGETYQIRSILREFGLEWSKRHKKWYWHEGDMTIKYHKSTPWEKIVEKHGHETIQTAKKDNNSTKKGKNNKKPVH